MNVIQKVILALGATIFIIVIAIYPAHHMVTVNNPQYNPRGVVMQGHPYIEVPEIDLGATLLRGISIIVATAALWAIAGKKKTD